MNTTTVHTRLAVVPALLVLAVFGITTNSCWAATYDAAADFEQGWITHSNPNGVWSYGYSSGFANPVTLYDQTAQPGVNGPNAQDWLSSSVNIGESPSAEFNDGPAFADGNVDFLANEFVLVAGIGGEYSDLVFTAPADGTYSVASNFRGAQNEIGTVVAVVANGSVLFSSSVTAVGQTVPFDTEVVLTAGSTVVFSVGPGGELQNTGLSVTITTAPPTTTTTGRPTTTTAPPTTTTRNHCVKDCKQDIKNCLALVPPNKNCTGTRSEKKACRKKYATQRKTCHGLPKVCKQENPNTRGVCVQSSTSTTQSDPAR